MSKAQKTKFELAVIDRVREIRLKKGFSQSYIASLLGTATSFISGVESPNVASKYNLNHLNRLAKELDCSPQEFIPTQFVAEDEWIEE